MLECRGFLFQVVYHTGQPRIIQAALCIVRIQFGDHFIDCPYPCFRFFLLRPSDAGLFRIASVYAGLFHQVVQLLFCKGKQMIEILPYYLHQIRVLDPDPVTAVCNIPALMRTGQVPVLFPFSLIDRAA